MQSDLMAFIEGQCQGFDLKQPEDRDGIVKLLMEFAMDRRKDRPLNSVWVGPTFKVPVKLPDRDETDPEQQRDGSLFVTCNAPEDWDKLWPLEVFAVIGKTGGDASILTDTICRLYSGWVQWGDVDPEKVLKHMEGIAGPWSRYWPLEQCFIRSIPDAIAKAIRRYMRDRMEEINGKAKALSEG